MRRVMFGLVLVSSVSACSTLPPERQLIVDAADALGGRARVEAAASVRLDGGGVAALLGQNQLPDGPLPTYTVTEFVRTIDLAQPRMGTRQVRTAQFAFAGATVTTLQQAVDGDVAFAVGASGQPTRGSSADAQDRRIERLHHPLTAVRAALDPAATVRPVQAEGDNDLVEVTTAGGDTVTLVIDRATKRPAAVRSRAAHPNLGDVVLTTSFERYQTVDGLQLPVRLVTTLDDYPQTALDITRQALDVPVEDLTAPDAVRQAESPAPPAQQVTVEPVGKGIWWLAGSGNHRSVVFEFADHLVLYEAPVSEARTKAVIDTARTLSTKPLTHAVVSHHHFDHSGGLRAAVAEGLTIVTHRLNEPFFKMLVARPFTIAPDALSRAPKPLVLELVDDTMTLKDSAMEVRLYHLRDNPREGTNLFAYVPRDRMLVQADLYDSSWLQHPWGDNVLANIASRGLKVDRMVPVHGAQQSLAEMEKTIRERGA